MFVLRPSSPIRSYEARPLESAGNAGQPRYDPPSERSPMDLGEDLPVEYEVDIIRALLQDPFRIFIYWEVQEKTLSSLDRYFEDGQSSFATVLKLLEVEGKHEVYFDVGPKGRYWMMVFPNKQYEFEIGVRSPKHGYIRIARSNRIRTPRGTVSAQSDEESDYRLSAPEFMNVIQESGFSADQALRWTVTAAPGQLAEPGLFRSSFEYLSAALRKALLATAEAGELSLEDIKTLPEPLRTELLRLYAAGGGRLACVGLVHYLPEMVREALETESEWIGDTIHPLHLTPRYFQGGTENLARPGGELNWPIIRNLPSSHRIG
jgi:hypothetical protein